MPKNLKQIVLAAVTIIIVIVFSIMWVISLNTSPPVVPPKPAIAKTASPIHTYLEPAPMTALSLTMASAAAPAAKVTTIGSHPQSDGLSKTNSNKEDIAFGKTVKHIPYNYSAMKEVALIRLDSDPRIEGTGFSTYVASRDETYTIFFKTAPDRYSVKSALLGLNPGQQQDLPRPKMRLYWSDDRQLHVKVLIAETKLDPARSGYILQLKGSKSSKGQLLDETIENTSFFANIFPPTQLWRYSTDGKRKNQLTKLTEPYDIQTLDNRNDFLLLSKVAHFCECDAPSNSFYSVYESKTAVITNYPYEVQLTTNYHGAGTFIADSRGFFFEQPSKGIQVPQSKTAHLLKFKEHIFGASFSKNHDYVIMAVGKAEQTKDYDLVIQSLLTGKIQRYPHVILSGIPGDEGFGRVLPFNFRDNGKRIYFTGTDEKTEKDLNFYYDWKALKVVAWSPPEEVTGWSGFTESDDGLYRLYFNGGLYKSAKKVSLPDSIKQRSGIWLPNTHYFIYQTYEDSLTSVKLLDADTLKSKTMLDNLPIGLNVGSASPDGKWLNIFI